MMKVEEMLKEEKRRFEEKGTDSLIFRVAISGKLFIVFS